MEEMEEQAIHLLPEVSRLHKASQIDRIDELLAWSAARNAFDLAARSGSLSISEALAENRDATNPL